GRRWRTWRTWRPRRRRRRPRRWTPSGRGTGSRRRGTTRTASLSEGLPMSSPGYGRIIWVEILDPQGRNPKCRPAVILTADADIRPDGEVWVVAISTDRKSIGE